MLNTKQLCDHLGVVVSIPFITDTLGVAPAKREKRGAFWSAENVAAVKTKMSAYLLALPAVAEPAGVDDLF